MLFSQVPAGPQAPPGAGLAAFRRRPPQFYRVNTVQFDERDNYRLHGLVFPYC